MFTETVERDGVVKPRFAYIDPQTEVLELAILDVISGQEHQFELAFQEAKSIISTIKGYISHDLQRCIENSNRYVLLVKWQTLEDHTIGFRESAEYQQWKKLLHHFYQPFPVVEHFTGL
ncbi:MAG: antibiotic biosynthesis monooxygenase [Arenicella sp.]|nr:antibiotic biosynthesis monooxygenase [Arenicella sp.]